MSGLRQLTIVGVLAATLFTGTTACSHDNNGSTSVDKPTPGTTSSTPSTSVPSAPSASSTIEPPTVAVLPQTKRAATRGVTDYIHVGTAVLGKPRSKVPQGLPVTGSALAALLATRNEYADKEYRVVGTPKVLSERVVKQLTKPPRLVVEACVDNSPVKVLDKRDKPVAGPPSAQKVRNLFTLRQTKTGWVVTDTGFAANPIC